MCCDHILGAIELKLGIRIPFGCEFNFLKLNPPSALWGGVFCGGGPLGDGALCFRGKGIVVTFLKLLSSNLVCKPYFGEDSNF